MSARGTCDHCGQSNGLHLAERRAFDGRRVVRCTDAWRCLVRRVHNERAARVRAVA